MQPHQYALGAGILWLTTLIVIPYLITKARARAFNRGLQTGKSTQNHATRLQLKEATQALQDERAELQLTQQTCEEQLAARQASIDVLKGVITELEARIMSYTGMAVTRADYDLLTKVGETLRLTQRTMKALKSEQQAILAANQALSIDSLAMRVHSQLRSTPATAATVEAA